MFAVGLILHKGAAAMSFGIQVKENHGDDHCLSMAFLIIFSLFTPLGVFLGHYVLADLGKFYEIIFSSLAAGTFIYIACSEVIVVEFTKRGTCCEKFGKLVAFMVGIGIITGLKVNESHSH